MKLTRSLGLVPAILIIEDKSVPAMVMRSHNLLRSSVLNLINVCGCGATKLVINNFSLFLLTAPN
jgi:hypothetical protein